MNETLANIDGKIVPYDACASEPNTYKTGVFKFIGRGTIHSVNGKRQDDNTVYYFYTYRHNWRNILQNLGGQL